MMQDHTEPTEEQTGNANTPTDRIRSLNDRLRTTGRGGMTVVTAGIAGLPPNIAHQVYAAIAGFAAFDDSNDPWGEHDCGSLNVATHSVIWKIDYYDRARRFLSPDPADPRQTIRVLTIMLAVEY